MQNLRSVFPALVALIALAGALSPLAATTYRFLPDEEMVDNALIIAEVEVLTAAATPSPQRPATRYQARVHEVLKGELAGSSVVFQVPGGPAEGGMELHIYGAPHFQAGQRALVLLWPREDGSHDILGMMLGAFYRVEAGGRSVALRNLEGTLEATADGAVVEARAPQARDWQRFKDWLADRAAGVQRTPDYFLDLPAETLQAASAPFTLFTGAGGRNFRWFEFDAGVTVEWRTHVSGQSSLAGGGTREFRTGLGVWTNISQSNVRLAHVGTTGASGGLMNFDGVNTVLFDDPNNEIASNCLVSGILAVGGFWSGSATGTFNGREFFRIGGADIVTNNGGTGCQFNDSDFFEQVISHEVGHTLGIGHSCDADGSTAPPPCTNAVLNDALMRAFAHNDNRGAQLNSDDRAAARFLYGAPSGPSAPAAPSDLEVALVRLNAALSWTDNSGDEEMFRVYRGQDGGALEVLAELEADTVRYLDEGLEGETEYSYQVASVRSGREGKSAVVTVTTPVVVPVTLTLQPTPPQLLTGTPIEFSVTTTGPVERINWGFGDDELAVSDAPCDADTYCAAHYFTDPGSYTLRVTAVGDLGQTASLLTPIDIGGGPGAFKTTEALIQSTIFGPRGDTGTFQSNLWMHNPSDTLPTLVELSFLRRGTTNLTPPTRRITLAPNQTLFLQNLLGNLFGESDTSGAVGLRYRLAEASPATPDVRSISRSFVELENRADGSFGQFVGADAATTFSEATKVVTGILEGGAFISTLLAANVSETGGRVDIELFDALGASVGDPAAFNLGARSMRTQPMRRLFPDVSSHPAPFTARFSTTSGIDFVASTTLLEAQSEDQIYVPAEDLSLQQGNPIYLPRVVRNQGQFNVFLISQLLAYNPSTADTELTLELLLRGQDNSSPQSQTLTVPSGQVVQVEDLMQELFGLTEATGALKITWANSEGVAPKILSYAFAQTEGGSGQRFGMLVNSRTADQATTGAGRGIDLGAEQSDLFRASYGVLSLNTDRNTRIDLVLRDSAGRVISTRTRNLRPQQHLELNLAGLFNETQIGEGSNWRVETQVVSGGPILSYIANINASGDIFFVPGGS